MSQAKVSIIVPVYNTAKYIDRCYNSINSQSYPSIEVIMVNDGSTDNSGEIIEDIASRAQHVVTVHQANQGLSGARRSGVLKATGDYVMFLDSDDTLPHDAIEYMVKTCEENNLDAFYGGHNRIVDGRVVVSAPRGFEGVVSGEEMLLNVLNPAFVFIGGMCFSRRRFWDADMFCKDRELPSEDMISNVRLAIKCNRIGVFDKPVYDYYLVSTSLTMTGRYYKQPYFKNLYNQLKGFLKESGKEDLTFDNVRMMEIYTFGFLLNEIDTTDDWYKQVLAYDVSRYPSKIKVLHLLMRWPWLLHQCVKGNRWMKKVFGLQR